MKPRAPQDATSSGHLLVIAGRDEQHGELRSGAGERGADLETAVVAQTDIREHGLGSEVLDGIQRARGAAGFRDNVVAAPLQPQPEPGGVPETGASSTTSTRGAPAWLDRRKAVSPCP